MRTNVLFGIGALSGLVSVILGAFAAHGLTHLISGEMVNVFKTGVQYQFYHTFALLLCAVLLLLPIGEHAKKYCYRAGICFIIGILCFSGSLYLLALTGTQWWGPVTPLGGVFFMIGWLCLVMAAVKLKKVTE